MSTTTLTAPIPLNTAGVHARPGLGRLVAVELRKMVDTRAGFCERGAGVRSAPGGSRGERSPRECPQPIGSDRPAGRTDGRGARHARPAFGEAVVRTASSTWSPLPRPEVVGFSRLRSVLVPS